MAELAEELQITDMKLTTYVSRHTMAMMLQRNNVSREQISQILGHADMKTTNTYLDSFDTTVIDEAAKFYMTCNFEIAFLWVFVTY